MEYNIKEVLTEEQTSKLVESTSEVVEDYDCDINDKLKICGAMMEDRWIKNTTRTLIIASALSSMMLISSLIVYKKLKK